MELSNLMGWTFEVVYPNQTFGSLISEASQPSSLSLQDVFDEAVSNGDCPIEDIAANNEVTIESDKVYPTTDDDSNKIRIEVVDSEVVYDNITHETTEEDPDRIKIETVCPEVVFDNSIKSKRAKKCKNLVEYEGFHTGAGYVCPNCSKVYSARKNLARHMNVECGKLPRFSCAYCQYRNHRRNEIKNHIRNKHMMCTFTQ
ncbi:hypothetical protein WA026_020866 [Henosepilachna vigintioctopunctata]|uniref:C2H2-type domain-containing protein n=1 Tax=Henosepilachna vigintioctopunctata TaxID=420089 RepID=A0AAW1US47_9CUCU